MVHIYCSVIIVNCCRPVFVPLLEQSQGAPGGLNLTDMSAIQEPIIIIIIKKEFT